ncbi:hypothetical protein GCM10010156_38260 [Planobispora rosea]|uniref:Uncharacterized protein n=1 Tax=Planobispora rosea TaxID=35762 RepID=A0A8J3WBI7_PLARO|nr:hypothetical protein GCM10010156_38260 [Planobispora rosea]GIH81901.1 hypothetical protein Pro02_03090 [Planobispora rosea]
MTGAGAETGEEKGGEGGERDGQNGRGNDASPCLPRLPHNAIIPGRNPRIDPCPGRPGVQEGDLQARSSRAIKPALLPGGDGPIYTRR